jgi:hypothetical protein
MANAEQNRDDLGIIDNLATQFSSAMDCFRELVQNSIDAGSPQVEVWMEYEPGKGHTGVIAIHVDDFGEGMDEQIIDNQLTKVFASQKENDLTKIGKFGIGFVSIFALLPRAVLLRTGRGGEYWEVFFYEDKTFTKTPLDTPVEGTQLTLYLEGDLRRYRQLSKDVRETLSRWCSQAEVEISFEDRTTGEFVAINEPFEVQGRCSARVEHPGTEIIVAYSSEPSYSFYNRGLLLFQTTQAEAALMRRAARYGHITFKMKSRYLEHTLARESIVQDENFERAMVLLDEAVNVTLLNELLGQLEALVQLPKWGHSEVTLYSELMRYLASEPASVWPRVAQRAIIAMAHGPAQTLTALYERWREDGTLLFSEAPSALVEQLAEQQQPVLFGRKTWSTQADLGAVAMLFIRYATSQVKATVKSKVRRVGVLLNIVGARDVASEIAATLATPQEVYIPTNLDDAQQSEPYQALLKRTHELLGHVKHHYKRVTTCRVSAVDTNPPLFVIGPQLTSMMMRPTKLGHMPRGLLRRPWHNWEIAINRDHATWVELVALSKIDVNMAAYCLARALLLTEDLPLSQTLELIDFARH